MPHSSPQNASEPRITARRQTFVLPSLLEALPTVAVEAPAWARRCCRATTLAELELNGLFGPDVSIVPGEQPIALGKAITHFLQHKRRTLARYQGGNRARIQAGRCREAIY